MAFTVTSTGEMPLQITGMTTGDILAANGTINNSGRASIVGSTCSDILAAGSTCTITVQYDAGTIESDIGYYSTPLLLSVTGNTRQQAPAKTSVYVTL